jgi:hypothetical protein
VEQQQQQAQDRPRTSAVEPTGSPVEGELSDAAIENLIVQSRLTPTGPAPATFALVAAPQLALSGKSARAVAHLITMIDGVETHRTLTGNDTELLSDLHFGLGLTHWFSGQFTAAAESFSRSAEQASMMFVGDYRYLRAIANQAFALRQIGTSTDEIERRFGEKRRAQTPSGLQERLSLGLLNYAAGALTRAIVLWRSTFEDGLSPRASANDRLSGLLAGNNLATALIETGETKEAANVLNEIIKVGGRRPVS